MPKVPVNQRRVQVESTKVQAMQVASLSKDVMAENVFEAKQQLGNTITKGLQQGMDYFEEQRKKDSEKRILDASNKALDDLQNTLTSPEIDDDGNPVGILNRKMGKAVGSTTDFTSKSVEVANKYMAELNPNEQSIFRERFNSHARASRDNVARHETREREIDLEEKFNTNVQKQVGIAANAIDINSLSEVIAPLKATTRSSLKAKGFDDESIAQREKVVVDQALNAFIATNIETNVDSAKMALESYKDQLTPEFYTKTNKVIEGKRFDNLRVSMWDSSFSKMLMADGNVDLSRVDKTIKASNFAEDQKIKLYDFAQAKAGEFRQIKTQREAANNDSFHNDFAQVRKKGLPLEEALKVAGRHGGDDWEKMQREEFVKKAYSNPVTTNPEVYLSTWEKVQEGSITKEELHKVWKNNAISNSDYESLTKDLYKRETTGEGDKGLDRVKLLAGEKFGNNDKEEKARFLYEVTLATKGMPAEQKLAYAQDALKSVVVSPGKLWDTKKPKYEVDLMKRDASSEAWGALYNDVGPKEIDALSKGMARKGAKSFGIDDVNNIANSLGGYEQLKIGSPANNAIKSLASKNKPVTLENIKAILADRPDGKW